MTFQQNPSSHSASARVFGICGLTLVTLGLSGEAFASGGIVNWYSVTSHGMGFHDEMAHDVGVVLAGVGGFVLCLLVGVVFKRACESGELEAPTPGFSFATFVEWVMEFVLNIAKDIIGHDYRKHFPLLAGLFIYIFVCNLSGLVPGFTPVTENFSANLVMAVIVFLVYNWAGIGEHKGGYIHQFLGPMVWIAPLMLVIELISHSVRPFSLAVRLGANIYSDHLLMGAVTGLVPLVVPSLLLFLGLLVASVQSFVFTLLTAIYIAMATSHDH